MIKESITIQNFKIFYYKSNNFNPKNCLVFVHGWGADAKIFEPILEKCNNFVAFDLPYFGRNRNLNDKNWDISRYASFLDDFLKKLNIENPILIGHSLGGAIVAKYCSCGGRAEKLILIANAGIRDGIIRRFIAIMLSNIIKIVFVNFLPRKYKEIVRKKLYKIFRFDLISIGELRDNFLKLINLDLREDFRNISTKTIIIWGKNDVCTPINNGKKINKLIKNSKLFIIPGAGHFVFLDKTKEFNNIFLDIIKE